MGEYVAEQHETREKAKLTGTPCMDLEIVLHVVTEIQGDAPLPSDKGITRRTSEPVARMSVATCGAAYEVNPDVAIPRRKTRVTALMAHPGYASLHVRFQTHCGSDERAVHSSADVKGFGCRPDEWRWPSRYATWETRVQHLHRLMRLPRSTFLRDSMILSARKMIASIDEHDADPSGRIYAVLTDPVGPADTRERWEQHLRGPMRLPRDMLCRKGMIIHARKMIAEKARQAPDSPGERRLAKADATMVKTK